MSSSALVLLLGAALAHAVWNFAAKGVRGDAVVFVWWYVLGSAVLWVPIAVADVVVGDLRPRWSWLGAAAVTAVAHIGYSLVLQHGYAVADLNVVYPLARGTGPLLTSVVAIGFLGEELRVAGVVGLLLVVAGVVVIATPGRGRPTHGSGAARGVLWGVLTGAGIACYTLWDDHAVTRLDVPPLPYFTLGLVVQLVLLTPRVLSRRSVVREVLRENVRPVVVVSVLSPLAYVLVLEAMRTTPVSLVAPVRESSIVVGALLSWLVLREPHPARRLLGSAVVLAGVAALVAG